MVNIQFPLDRWRFRNKPRASARTRIGCNLSPCWSTHAFRY